MANPETAKVEVEEKHAYSVWSLPPDDVAARLKKLMESLRSEFGGPHFEPHITVVGAISLTPDDALRRFRSACEGVKAYAASVDRVATGHCVLLLVHPTAEVVETSAHCNGHFGYKRSSPYMPHLSLLYGDLTEEDMKKAEEKANILDETIRNLSFQVTRLALYKTDTEDKTLKSWEKIVECNLTSSVEYIVSDRIFEALPPDELKLWHSHAYEIKSGLWVNPRVPGMIEKPELENMVKTCGKFWCTWQVDRGDELPLGAPALMMSPQPVNLGQISPELVHRRDNKYNISTEVLRDSRVEIAEPEWMDQSSGGLLRAPLTSTSKI